MRKMPSEGSLLGVNLGWSTERKSSAVCCLAWDEHRVNWQICRFRAYDEEREQAFRWAAGDRTSLAIAIDGPLRPGFSKIGRYRSAERLLSRGKLLRVGKPGQSNSPNGEKLNEQANLTAWFVKEYFRIERANAASIVFSRGCCPVDDQPNHWPRSKITMNEPRWFALSQR